MLALIALLWFAVSREVASRAATGLLGRTAGGTFVQLLGAVFLLFLLVLGFVLLAPQRSSVRDLLALPRRPSAGREWAIGAALGWGAAILAVLPMLFTGALYLQLWVDARSSLAAVLAIATAAVLTLCIEAVFRGFAFRQLAEVTGPAWATVLLSAIYAVITTFNVAGWTTLLVAFLAGVLLTNAWLRTHGLWLSWGLHFAWIVALGALFGLPINGDTDLATIIQTQLSGKSWLTGFGRGPLSAPWTAIVLLLALAILFRLTRDFAWQYTHKPITAAGYPMEVAPPPAHAAMEAAAPPPPLVQILPTTPQDRSRIGD